MSSRCFPEPSPALTIFDWDDTFFPRTWLQNIGVPATLEPEHIPRGFIDYFQPLTKIISTILVEALRHGKVYIVTNAREFWIHRCIDFYVPGLKGHIKNMHIVSAQDKFAEKFPEDVDQWKIEAFKEIKAQLQEERSIISIGDSQSERIALHKVFSGSNSKHYTKCIKFLEHPDYNFLLRQLNLISNTMDYIYAQASDIDIYITL